MTRVGDRPVVPAAAALEISVQGASADGCRSTCALKSTEPQLVPTSVVTNLASKTSHSSYTRNLTKKNRKCAIHAIRVNKPDQAVPTSIWSSLRSTPMSIRHKRLINFDLSGS